MRARPAAVQLAFDPPLAARVLRVGGWKIAAQQFGSRSEEWNAVSEIVLIGAAGTAGIRLVGALTAARVDYRVVSHSEAGATRLTEAGASSITVADLAEPSTLASAMTNTSVVYAIPPALHPARTSFFSTPFG